MRNGLFLVELRQCLITASSHQSVVGSFLFLLSLAVLRFLKERLLATSGEDFNAVQYSYSQLLEKKTTHSFTCSKEIFMVATISLGRMR